MEIFCAASAKPNDSDAVRRLLALAVSELWGISLPVIGKTPGGKPFFPGSPDIFFSLSHSKSHVLCAVGSSPVGADIEEEREINPRLTARICAPEETKSLGFFDLWVLKESYIKLADKTDVPMRDIRFGGSAGRIVSPCADIFSRLYNDVPGAHIGICSFSPRLPEKIRIVGLPPLRNT